MLLIDWDGGDLRLLDIIGILVEIVLWSNKKVSIFMRRKVVWMVLKRDGVFIGISMRDEYYRWYWCFRDCGDKIGSLWDLGCKGLNNIWYWCFRE